MDLQLCLLFTNTIPHHYSRAMRLAIALRYLFLVVPLVSALRGTTMHGAAANNLTFDYVVIGAGLAGLTVAYRLSELDATVLYAHGRRGQELTTG